MQKLTLTLLLLFACLSISIGQDQSSSLDSLENTVKNTPSDSSKVELLAKFCFDLCYSDVENAIYFGKKALKLSRKINYPLGELKTLMYLTSSEGILQGNFELGLKYLEQAEKLAIQLDKKDWLLKVYNGFGVIYNYKGITIKALEYYLLALKL
nr:tetratricopeptide repeat protein [Flammeovirgaceae bacterium]